MKEILGSLKIPKGCQMDMTVSLSTFLANFDGSNKEKQDFKNKVNFIKIHAQINPQDVNLASYITEDEHYQSLLFIEVNLKNIKDISGIDESIHKTIPQPSFIFYSKDKHLRVSAPTKRVNKVYRSKSIVESFWISKETTIEEYNGFLSQNFDERKGYKMNLKHLFNSIQRLLFVYEYNLHLFGPINDLEKLSTYALELKGLEVKEKQLEEEYEHANMKKDKLIFHKMLLELKDEMNIIISKFKGE